LTVRQLYVAILNRYGMKDGQDLITLANSRVDAGDFSNVSDAVAEVERQNGLQPTSPG
jgi:hypothetical protein